MHDPLPHVTDMGMGAGLLPVVFLHSLAGTRRHWTDQLQSVQATRRGVAIDLLGHGANPTPVEGRTSIEQFADDVVTTANQLGLSRFTLVGHSFGAGVAICCATRVPDLVAGLFLADPVGDQRQAPRADLDAFLAAIESPAYRDTVRGFWNRILEGGTAATKRRVLADLHETRPEVVVAAFRALLDFDPTSALRKFSGPAFSIITPFNDFPYSLHRLVPDLQYERITGTSHWLHMDQPAHFNAALRRFLDNTNELTE